MTRKPLARAARLLPGLTTLVPLLLAAACASAPDPRGMHFPPESLTEPEVTQLTLDNGIRLYLLPDHTAPLIHLRALVRTGTAYEPADQPGVYAMAGDLMRDGGAGDLDPDAFDTALADAAIRMGSNVGRESGGASVVSLTRNFPLALARFADMLRRPRFDAARLETAKAQEIDAIRRRDDIPGAIAGRLFRRTLYGPDSPLAREPTVDDVARITRGQLVAFHRQWYRPDAIALGVTGDFEVPAMVEALKGAFGDWQAPPAPEPVPPKVAPTEHRVVRIVDRPVEQVVLFIGQISIRRQDPDFYALRLANVVLGGQPFMSRLFQDVRTREGLAYRVGSALRPNPRHLGDFVMSASTRPEQVGQAVALMLDEVRRLRDEPVPEAELHETQESFLNGFVFSSATSAQVLGRRMGLDYNGLPPDELERVRARTLATTPADLQAAVRRQLEPDRMAIVAIGDKDVLTEALAPFGDVEVVPWEGPGGARNAAEEPGG
jgi:zinc protease